MADGYEIFTMAWQERQIEVSYQANWLRSGHWHIELRSPERLPLTETGYRSIFVPESDFSDEFAIKEFVIWLLDETATNKDWQEYLQASRQLDLF